MELELTKENLADAATIKANSTKAEEVVSIELDKILVRDDFNVRQEYGDIKGLAKSIIENGQALPGRVDALADGTFVLTDGHRRFKALQLLAKEYDHIKFKAIVNGKKTTEEQRIIQMFITQDNKQLENYEVAELIQRLVNLGYKQKDIAKQLGKTAAYISQMLEYAAENPTIKDAVKNGKISVSTVIKVKKVITNTEQRTAAITKAIEKKADKKAANNGKADKGEKKGVTLDDVIEQEPTLDKKAANKDAKALELAQAICDLYDDELGDIDTKPMISLIKSYL